MKKIIIFGAGLSGLTIAHELLEKGFDVYLYEKGDFVGGMARSRREEGGVPSETSWRGYAPFYSNAFNILKRLNLYDNLSGPVDFHVIKDENREVTVAKNADMIPMVLYFLRNLFANNRMEEYDQTSFAEKFKGKLSQDGYDFFVNYVGEAGYGMEKKDMSMGHYFWFPILAKMCSDKYTTKGPSKISKINGSSRWFVMNQPTNEAWVNPWVDFLKNKGLKLFLNSELANVNFEGDKVGHVLVNIDDKMVKITADEYVLAINPFEAEKLVGDYIPFKNMNQKTESNQISFRLGLIKPLKFPNRNICFIHSDSKYNITWYPQENHWKEGVSLGQSDKGEILSLWSGTLMQTYKNDSRQTTKEELLEKIIKQILNSKKLQKVIFKSNGFYLAPEDFIYREIWYEWKPVEGILQMDPKKWVNTIHTEKHRLKQETPFTNLFLSGAHTKTSIKIWSMEGAVEAGKLTANKILEKWNKPTAEYFKHEKPAYIKPFQMMDDTLFALKLPNVLDFFLILLVILLAILLVKKLLKNKPV